MSMIPSVIPIMDFVKREFSYLNRMKYCLGYPRIFAIETTNYCNLHCIMCPVGTGKITRKKGFIDFNLFRKIIQENKHHIVFTWLHLAGEPLLHPDLVKMVRFCKENGVYCGMSTNAVLLNPKIARELLDAELDRITLPVDGNTKETYERVRRGAKFEQVMENVIGFLKLKKAGRFVRPVTELQLIRMKQTEKDIKSFHQTWTRLGADHVLDKGFDTGAGQMNEEATELTRLEHRMGHSMHAHTPKRYPCAYLWHSIVVLWDGTVVPCCRDYNGTLPLGNLKYTSPSKIWNNRKMRELRKKHILGEWHEIPLCAKCPEWLGYALNVESIIRPLLQLRAVIRVEPVISAV